MTLSVLMYAMMVFALAAFLGILVVDVRRNRGEVARLGGRAARSSTYDRGRVQRRRVCPDAAGQRPQEARRAAPSAPPRSRRSPAAQEACRR
jgi:hypothetical protein